MKILERGKISGRQLMALLVLIRLVPVTISFPLMTGLDPVQDAWIPSILGTLAAIPFVILVVKLGQRFPNRTIVQYTEDILGPVLGKMVSAFFIWYLLQIIAIITRMFGESFTIAIMPETPILVFIIIITFLAANAARSGLEVFSRMAENSLFVVILFLIITVFLPFDVIQLDNLRPVLTEGISWLIEPTGTVLSFFAKFIVLGMVFPYLSIQREAAKYAILATIISGSLTTILAVVVVAVFGPTASSLTMPALSLARMISIAQFLERIEVVIMGAWVLSTGINLALYIWAAALSVAQFFRLSSYQPLVYPLGAITVSLSLLFWESAIGLERFLQFEFWGFSALVYTMSIVGVLFGGLMIRSLFSNSEEG